MYCLKKNTVLDHVAVFFILWTSGSVSGFMLNASILVPLFLIFSVYYFFSRKRKFEKNAFVAYLFYIIILLASYFFVGKTHSPSDMNIFSVYLMLATGALLTFQSINFESLKHAFLNVVTVIATTGLALFLLHSLDLLPTVHVYKHGSSIPYMMFAFNNFGWFNSFNRLAGPYWEPGAFQIILNYTLLIFFEDLSKLRLAKNDALKLLIIVFAVIMTKSTTGYIFLAIFSIFVIFNSKMTKKNVVRFLGIGLAIVFSCFAIFSSDTIQKKFDQKGEKGSSYEIRQADNLAMLQMTIERPFVGYGIVSNEFRQRGKVLGNVTSSNGPLAITSQIGIPFFLLLLFFNHKALKQLHYKRAKLLLFMIILLNSSEVFFYFPLFFIFIFINKTHNEVEK